MTIHTAKPVGARPLMPRLVGLSGRKDSGKTEAAKSLMKDSYSVVSFATPIKAMAAALYRSAGADNELIGRKLFGDMKEQPCEILGATPRKVLQTLGTQWGRSLIDQQIWETIAPARITSILEVGCRVVVDDVRFESEAALIRMMGSPVIEVRDPATAVPTDNHPTESGVRADEVVLSDRSLGLRAMIDSPSMILLIMSPTHA